MQTDQKITTDENVRWMLEGVNWFRFKASSIEVPDCKKYDLKGTEGFFKRAGVLTFLKTTTQLQIWFDDVLEVTWVYKKETCDMRNEMEGLRFYGLYTKNYDRVSTHYRYQIGNCLHKALFALNRPIVFCSK